MKEQLKELEIKYNKRVWGFKKEFKHLNNIKEI